MGKVDLNQVMPLAIMWIVWIIAFVNVVKHFRHGRMRAYTRGGSGHGEPGHYETSAQRHPFTYWLLLLFYSLVVIAVPAVTVWAIFYREG